MVGPAREASIARSESEGDFRRLRDASRRAGDPADTMVMPARFRIFDAQATVMKVTIALPQVDKASNISRWQGCTSAHFPLAKLFLLCRLQGLELRLTRDTDGSMQEGVDSE